MLHYHFTDADHWPDVLSCAEIRPTWQRGGSPLTVHLSKDPDPSGLRWKLRDRTVRIAVRVPHDEAHSWLEWSRPYLAPEERFSLIEPSSVNQWNGDPASWFIVERPIPMADWVYAEDLAAVQRLWP
ncbi:hypothetical protein AB0D12_37815 [Streptomyces sp. NPDC048479]|uniref:hypothetical protein n=1 Tax=Streptomyces sp. NPDC048479 TaxID=3154725 RepID=UPI00342987B6